MAAGIVIMADLAIAGWVYYITPYHKHFLAPQATAFDAQPAMAAICGIIAVICIILAVMMLRKSPERTRGGQKK